MARRKTAATRGDSQGLFVEPTPEIEPGMTGNSQRDAMRREAIRVRATYPDRAGFINQLLARLAKNDEATKPKK